MHFNKILSIFNVIISRVNLSTIKMIALKSLTAHAVFTVDRICLFLKGKCPLPTQRRIIVLFIYLFI